VNTRTVDKNDNKIKRNPEYYKRLHAICEHPFGTIKRHFGYTHTLLKGVQKVNGEMNLIMFFYNFMCTKNILGIEKMLQAIEKWTTDYDKVIFTLQKYLRKAIYSQKGFHFFFRKIRFRFIQVV
jgi:hypothetical protein